jgi:hypothetical protein
VRLAAWFSGQRRNGDEDDIRPAWLRAGVWLFYMGGAMAGAAGERAWRWSPGWKLFVLGESRIVDAGELQCRKPGIARSAHDDTGKAACRHGGGARLVGGHHVRRRVACSGSSLQQVSWRRFVALGGPSGSPASFVEPRGQLAEERAAGQGERGWSVSTAKPSTRPMHHPTVKEVGSEMGGLSSQVGHLDAFEQGFGSRAVGERHAGHDRSPS